MKVFLTALCVALALATVFADAFRYEPMRYVFACLLVWLAVCVWRSE